MNVSLTPELEKFVQSEVSSGLYQTASEVIRAGLRRLKEDKEMRTRAFPISEPAKPQEFEASLLQSIKELDKDEAAENPKKEGDQ
jgi:putative addiction module CopG family antidote